MVKADVARQKIARGSARLGEAEAIVSRPLDEFLADPRERDLASFYLLLAIQEAIDLAAHWVADAGWSPPEDASSTFDLLASRGEIDRDLANGLRAAAGLRNRIAHGYSTLDHTRLHAEFSQGVTVLRRFLSAVAKAAGL
jgi:uncharacterized protein YutE (UPF0331/DUF86 family)